MSQNTKICMYQLISELPHKRAKKVPKIKKGAKGSSLFKPFLCKNISATPIIAPNAKAKNKPAKMLGKPKINPNSIASFTSPKPIHRPRENINIAKKKAVAKNAANK